MLVRGAGTGAIRLGLHSFCTTGDRILVHDAPIYPSTKVSMEMLGLLPVYIDFHDKEKVEEELINNDIKAVLIQLTRQTPDVFYDLAELIKTIRLIKQDIRIITDDNYAVMKVEKVGYELGADLTTFSTFKLLGPEGIGCIVGKKDLIRKLREENYSGGGQVQGHEALDVLRGLIYAPVSLAISAKVVDEVVNRLNKGEISGIDQAFVANAQSRVVIVKFKDEIAEEVIQIANDLGGAPYPVGSESKYEFVPMFYRVSHSFYEHLPNENGKLIRINPMRSGEDTILRILGASVRRVGTDITEE